MRHYDYIISQSESYAKLIRKKCFSITKKLAICGQASEVIGQNLTINA